MEYEIYHSGYQEEYNIKCTGLYTLGYTSYGKGVRIFLSKDIALFDFNHHEDYFHYNNINEFIEFKRTKNFHIK